MNVTPRTTHVISSGVRTINLLKGILRGCWLLTLEWALKSLESSKWLDPAPYEMCYFSKAVQVKIGFVIYIYLVFNFFILMCILFRRIVEIDNYLEKLLYLSYLLHVALFMS